LFNLFAPSTRKSTIDTWGGQIKADGDLSFKTGDRIELVEKTASADDWWTGKTADGKQGVFPGTYVQET
jgi:amphiphysin